MILSMARAMSKNKLASIIVPAYNEEKLIERTLLSLKGQSYKPIEIIVVYRGDDRTGEIAKKHTNRVFPLQEKGASRARNFGAKKAQGHYLFFLDADSKLEHDTVQSAVNSLDKKNIAGGTAKIVYQSKNYKIKGVEVIQNFCLNRWGIFLCQFIYTTKEVFKKSGGWSESIDFGEDMNFLKRLSAFGELKYDSQNQVLTSPRRFLKNKDYFYAVLGGFLVLGGIKNLPFYAIRDDKETEKEKSDIESLLNKEISLSPQTQRFFLNIINKEKMGGLFERYKKILMSSKKSIKTNKVKALVPLMVWGATKAVFLPLWFLIGLWIWQRAGILGVLPFVAIIGFFQATDFWNQFLISKTVKSLKDFSETKESLREKNLISEKIWQLEVKRSPFTAVFYILKRAGFNKIPRYSPQKELADIGPSWIGKEVGLILGLLYSIFYYLFYHAHYLSQIKLRGKTIKDLSIWAPFRIPIIKSSQEKGVFLGADIGCGDGKIIKLLASYCKKEKLPAVLFGMEPQSDIIEVAFQRFKKNGFTVLKNNEGRVSIDKLTNMAKKEGGPVICFINAGLENISQLFEPRSLDLIFIVNAKHHLEDAWSNGGRRAIEKTSEHWLILEERRSWAPFVFFCLAGWLISRIIICEAEDSILSMHTPEEWASQKIKTITTFPFLVWAMSDSLYEILKKERGIV